MMRRRTLVDRSLVAAIALVGATAAVADTRDELRRAVGDLEARAAHTRALVREGARLRGEELERFRARLNEELIPALERDVAHLRERVAGWRDEPLVASGIGVEIAIESCWPKWSKWFAADKYLFRALVRSDTGVEIRSMAVREPSNGDLDRVRIPQAAARGDGRPGNEYAIYDSFKIWGRRSGVRRRGRTRPRAGVRLPL